MSRGILRVATAAACVACATPATQSPPPKSSSVLPCGAAPSGSTIGSQGGCDLPSDAPVATVDGASITAGELPEAVRARAGQIAAEIAAAQLKELRRVIDDTLLDLEAARRQVSLRDLWAVEVLSQVPAPTEAELRARYDENVKKGNRGGSYEEERAALESQLFAAALETRETAFARSLESRFPVVMRASPVADGPPGEVLATAGDAPITRRAARARLDAAAFLVRGDLWGKQFAAADELATDRVLKAEAARLGVSTEELKKDDARMNKLEEEHPVKVLIPRPPAPVMVPDLTGAPSRGDANAPVTMVEYGDFQCPPCGKMWTVMEEALKPYGRRVRFVFHNSPLPFHADAQKAAEAASAAHAQGRFFDYADVLFRHQTALDVASLKRYAAEAGLDTTRFAAELDGGRYAAAVRLERRGAIRVTALYTPSFLVNGVPLHWQQYSVEGIRAAVDAALTKAGAPVPAVPSTSR